MAGYWSYEKSIRRAEAKVSSVPGVTGAIYMIRRETFEPIPNDTILDDVLIPMNVVAGGYQVGFDERAVAWDIPSRDPVIERRRKIRTNRGNYQLLFRHPGWLFPQRHPIWWQYLSHKILRLAVPMLALINFLAAFVLAIQGIMWAQLYCCVFALGLVIYPLSKRLEVINRFRLTRLAASFVALNWFSVLGLLDFLSVKRSDAWKK